MVEGYTSMCTVPRDPHSVLSPLQKLADKSIEGKEGGQEGTPGWVCMAFFGHSGSSGVLQQNVEEAARVGRVVNKAGKKIGSHRNPQKLEERF